MSRPLTLDEQPAAWSRALERAVDRQTGETLRHLHTDRVAAHETWTAGRYERVPLHVVSCFEVRSFSEADLFHKVQLRSYGCRADVEVSCSCRAHGPCWHAALVLYATGHLLPHEIEEAVKIAADDLKAQAAYDAELAAQAEWERAVVADAEALAAELGLDGEGLAA